MPRLLYVKTPAPEREPRLAELLAHIKQEASDSYRYFRTPAELGRLVGDDLATLVSERFTASAQPIDPGWLPPPRPPMTGLPTGTVTFLFSDIEGSTRLVQDLATCTGRSETPMRRSCAVPPRGAAGSSQYRRRFVLRRLRQPGADGRGLAAR